MELIDWIQMKQNFSRLISLGQESGAVLGSYDKSLSEFKPVFDSETELSFYVRYSKGFKYMTGFMYYH